MKIIRPVGITGEFQLTRATPATYLDASGILQTAAIDEARYGYAYVDGGLVYQGLIFESEATNLLIHSNAFSEWEAVGSLTVSSDDVVSPDGTQNADTITFTAPHELLRQEVQTITGENYTLSVWLKAAAGSPLPLLPGPGWTIVDVSDDWVRYQITERATGSVMAVEFRALDAGEVYIYGAQLERGARATSLIISGPEPGHRAEDVVALGGLAESSVPEDDYPEWTAGTLTKGDRRILVAEHAVYEVVADTTTDDPLTGIAADPPTWMKLGPTNRWRAFDDKVGTATQNPDSIYYSIMPGAGVDAIAFFGVDAGGVHISVTDPFQGEIYSSFTAPVLTDGVETWYDYFFAPIELREDFVVSGLGATKYCRIDITFAKSGGIARVGAIAMGKFADLGFAVYGTSVGITDYSRKERDAFGNTIIVERAYSKRADFQVALDTREVGRVQRLLAQYRAMPIVWIGADEYEETLVYGFYRDFDIVISGPSISDANISVEGLT